MRPHIKKRRLAEPKTEVIVWASSHGLVRHYFESSFEEHFKEQWRFEMPEIHAKGGRKIDDELVEQINSDLSSRKRPCVCILILATNNVRKRCSEKDLDYVVKLFEKVTEHAAGLDKVQILISQLVPSVAPVKSKSNFQRLEAKLAAMIQKYPKAHLAKTTKALCFYGKIEKHLWEDKVHLNEEGAEIYTAKLFEQLNNLPRFALE